MLSRIFSVWLFVFFILSKTQAFAASKNFECVEGIALIGVGTESISIKSIAGKGFDWDSKLAKSSSNENSDCLDARRYQCYTDGQAMVNIPHALIDGYVDVANVYITTDVDDQIPGFRYKCFLSTNK